MHSADIHSEHKLFVGNVPAGTTYDELLALFKQFGEPDEVYLVPKTGTKARHYAFVRFPLKEMADRAIEALNLRHLLSLSTDPITVRFADNRRSAAGPSPTMVSPRISPRLTSLVSPSSFSSTDEGYKLFVGSLPLSITKESLHALFCQFGDIREIIMLKAGRGTHLSAFVKFETEDAANAAVDAFDAKHVMQDATTGESTTIQVRPRYQRGGPNTNPNTNFSFSHLLAGPPPAAPAVMGQRLALPAPAQVPFLSSPTPALVPPIAAMPPPPSEPPSLSEDDGWKLFVGNLPLSIDNPQLETLFGAYGEIKEIIMLRAGRGTHLSCFVKMRTKEAATAAIAALDGKHTMTDRSSGIDTRIQVRARFGVQDGKGIRSFGQAAGHGGYGVGLSGGAGSAGGMEEAKLFVGNLPLTTQKEDVDTLFEKHGHVKEVIMLGRGRGGTQSCFVKHATVAQAQASIDALDGKVHLTDSNSGNTSTIQVRWASRESKRRRPEPEGPPPPLPLGLSADTQAAYQAGVMAAMQQMQAHAAGAAAAAAAAGLPPEQAALLASHTAPHVPARVPAMYSTTAAAHPPFSHPAPAWPAPSAPYVPPAPAAPAPFGVAPGAASAGGGGSAAPYGQHAAPYGHAPHQYGHPHQHHAQYGEAAPAYGASYDPVGGDSNKRLRPA